MVLVKGKAGWKEEFSAEEKLLSYIVGAVPWGDSKTANNPKLNHHKTTRLCKYHLKGRMSSKKADR